jgi:hypothetical protein
MLRWQLCLFVSIAALASVLQQVQSHSHLRAVGGFHKTSEVAKGSEAYDSDTKDLDESEDDFYQEEAREARAEEGSSSIISAGTAQLEASQARVKEQQQKQLQKADAGKAEADAEKAEADADAEKADADAVEEADAEADSAEDAVVEEDSTAAEEASEEASEAAAEDDTNGSAAQTDDEDALRTEAQEVEADEEKILDEASEDEQVDSESEDFENDMLQDKDVSAEDDTTDSGGNAVGASTNEAEDDSSFEESDGMGGTEEEEDDSKDEGKSVEEEDAEIESETREDEEAGATLDDMSEGLGLGGSFSVQAPNTLANTVALHSANPKRELEMRKSPKASETRVGSESSFPQGLEGEIVKTPPLGMKISSSNEAQELTKGRLAQPEAIASDGPLASTQKPVVTSLKSGEATAKLAEAIQSTPSSASGSTSIERKSTDKVEKDAKPKRAPATEVDSKAVAVSASAISSHKKPFPWLRKPLTLAAHRSETSVYLNKADNEDDDDDASRQDAEADQQDDVTTSSQDDEAASSQDSEASEDTGIDAASEEGDEVADDDTAA